MADVIESKTLSPVPMTPSRASSSTGTLVTLVIIVGVIIVGALYVWGERVAETRATIPTEEIQ